MNWLSFTRGTIHPHPFAIALWSHFELSEKLTGVPIVDLLYFNEGPKLFFAWNEKKLKKLGKHILEICKTKTKGKKHFERFDEYMEKAIEAAEDVYETDLRKCSDEKLINLYDHILKHASPAHGLLNVDIDAFDVVFEGFLKNKIKNEMKSRTKEDEPMELYHKLSIPVYKTYTSQEEVAIIKAILEKKTSRESIERLRRKYWWTGLGWENLAPHSKKYFKGKIREFEKEGDLEKKLKEISSYSGKIKKQRFALIKSYQLTENLKGWLEVLDRYTYYHEARKEMQVKTNYAAHVIMLEAARRLRLNKNDLIWLWYGEIKSLLRGGKIDKSEITRRKKAVLVIIKKNKFEILSGQSARERYEKEIDQAVKETRNLKGFGASGGKLRGRVKICRGYRDAMNKIKKGDILVCGMTTPDYVPAMRKASAVITDEGGLTSHAAIIARELGIPCIIGIKIATKILKDGDLVEVDADKGIVAIIK